ncbi:hypothetical protein LY76DRAFT_380683 [Colletotrichum caudatum]|nr:hypothetical protein LY76DRAFT_380683 [Colletotrichum caudatum]
MVQAAVGNAGHRTAGRSYSAPRASPTRRHRRVSATDGSSTMRGERRYGRGGGEASGMACGSAPCRIFANHLESQTGSKSTASGSRHVDSLDVPSEQTTDASRHLSRGGTCLDTTGGRKRCGAERRKRREGGSKGVATENRSKPTLRPTNRASVSQ